MILDSISSPPVSSVTPVVSPSIPVVASSPPPVLGVSSPYDPTTSSTSLPVVTSSSVPVVSLPVAGVSSLAMHSPAHSIPSRSWSIESSPPSLHDPTTFCPVPDAASEYHYPSCPPYFDSSGSWQTPPNCMVKELHS